MLGYSLQNQYDLQIAHEPFLLIYGFPILRISITEHILCIIKRSCNRIMN